MPQRAATAFLGRLEDHLQRSVEAAVLGQPTRGSQQHCRVTIVAAGVHHARPLAGPVRAGHLLNWKRVHIGTQANALPSGAAHESADDTGAANTALDCEPPALELVSHQCRRAVLLECELGFAVDVAAQADELAYLCIQRVSQIVRFGCVLGFDLHFEGSRGRRGAMNLGLWVQRAQPVGAM